MRFGIPVLAVFVGVAACSTPATPSPTPLANNGGTTNATPPISGTSHPDFPTGSLSVSGVVTESTSQGDRPLGHVGVNAWVETPGISYSYWYAFGTQYTDEQGRYDLTRLPEGATVQLEVFGSGFVPQCAPAPLIMTANHQLDAHLVAESNVSATPESVPPSAPGFRLVSGVVYQVTDGVRRPASMASVQYEPSMDSPAAATVTDRDGRFLLCGIPQDRTAWISGYVAGGGYAYVEVPPGPDAVIEVELN